MNNKFLVRLYVPSVEMCYEVWISPNKKIYNLINLFVKAVKEQSKGYYDPQFLPDLYNKETAQIYKIEQKVIETDIRNGTELILV